MKVMALPFPTYQGGMERDRLARQEPSTATCPSPPRSTTQHGVKLGKPRNALGNGSRAVRISSSGPHRLTLRGGFLFCWLIVFSWPVGCVSHPYLPGEQLSDDRLLTHYLSQLHDRRPGFCKLTQRVLVHVDNTDFDMTAYLWLAADDSWQGVALGDMGMKLYELRFDGTRGEILSKPNAISQRPIHHGVIGDIQHLFGRKQALNAHLVEEREQTVGVVLRRGNAYIEEYRFSEGQSVPLRSLEARDGRIVREASYFEPRYFEDCHCTMPTRIILRNYQWEYSMEIVLLDAERTE